MIKPDIPQNEPNRISAVKEYDILDSNPERLYDDLVMLASQICDCPISFISIMDKDRQWFKSITGASFTDSPRDTSFCGHTILEPDQLMEVPDTLEDERFVGNPLVNGKYNIRFYAGMPIVDDKGNALGTICVVDHKPKKLNENQKEALKALSRQVFSLLQLRKVGSSAQNESRQKSNFLSMMSHEIRTPLNSIIGLSDILIKENPREDQLDTLKMLDFSARNLLKLLNDILDLNKLESGKLILENEPFEIVNFLDQLQQTYAFQASQKGLEFHCEIDPATPAIVLGDPTRLAQILNNLFSNAIKFTDTGFIALNVKVRSYKNESVDLRFIFSDSGMGIPKDKQQMIFQNFTQASQDTFRKYGGTGLGLSIIKNLLEYMGSSIELYSEDGKGSTFTFDLTFECPENQNCGKKENLNTNKVDHIMVIEDDKINRLLLEKNLRKHGYRVMAFDTGADALENARQNDYQAIIIDLQLPGKDGLQLISDLRQINQHYTNIPIIAISAAATKDVRDSALKMGANDFLPKPHEPEDLIRRLKNKLI